MSDVRCGRDSPKMLIKQHVLAAFAVALSLFAAAGPAGAAPTHVESSVLQAVNAARAAHALAPLKFDSALSRAARAHSTSMVASGAFAHGDVRQRLRSFGVRSSFLGE